MALINKRVSVNNFIHENINDAFNTVQLVADNLEQIGIIAKELEDGNLHPEYYTQAMADALFASKGSTYTTGDADIKFATILNFNTTGILDESTGLILRIDSNDNVGIDAIPEVWHTNYLGLEFGKRAAIYGGRSSSNLEMIGMSTNQFTDAGGANMRKVIGPIGMYEQVLGQHKFYVKEIENLVSVTTAGAGETYFIEFINDTDFTLIGAASNTVGLKFTATGPGIGTGVISSVIINPVLALYINDVGQTDIPNLKFTPGAIYTSVKVEDAINEVFTLLGSTLVNKGASLIGVKDTAGYFAATNLEDILTELYTSTVIPADINLPGNPTTTTQSPGNNSTRIATTEYVDNIANGIVIDTFPATPLGNILALVDAGKLIRFTASLTQMYIDAEANINFPIGTIVTFSYTGSGTCYIDIVPGSGVSLSGGLGSQLPIELNDLSNRATVIKVASDTWEFFRESAYGGQRINGYTKGATEYISVGASIFLLSASSMAGPDIANTIGPEGSGAAIELAAMNSIPDNATHIILSGDIQISGSFQARYTGILVAGGYAGATVNIGNVDFINPFASLGVNKDYFSHKRIPLDSLNRFNMHFSSSGISETFSSNIYFHGFATA